MTTRKNNHTLTGNEQGFASIVIALVLIVILGLLTVGFAQLARREQRNALDKQLANQAYYAAESGIDDATQDIRSGTICDTAASSTCAGTDTSSTSCMTKPGAGFGTQTLPVNALTATPSINSSNGVSYSCLLVDLTPSSLVFSDTPPAAGQNLAFSATAASGPISNLTIQWGSADGQANFQPFNTFPAGGKFPPLATWNGLQRPPLLLFSLTPAGAISRNSLINSTFNVYLYPANNATGYSIGAPGNPASTTANISGGQAQIVPGNCGHDGSSAYPCSVTITGLSASSYVLHYLPYYDTANLYVTGTNSTGNPVNFIGQAEIDVTGKAHNVLKRLQAHLVANATNGTIGTAPILPDYALEAQNICKRLQTRPNNTDYISSSGSNVDTGSDPCNLDN